MGLRTFALFGSPQVFVRGSQVAGWILRQLSVKVITVYAVCVRDDSGIATTSTSIIRKLENVHTVTEDSKSQNTSQTILPHIWTFLVTVSYKHVSTRTDESERPDGRRSVAGRIHTTHDIAFPVQQWKKGDTVEGIWRSGTDGKGTILIPFCYMSAVCQTYVSPQVVLSIDGHQACLSARRKINYGITGRVQDGTADHTASEYRANTSK